MISQRVIVNRTNFGQQIGTHLSKLYAVCIISKGTIEDLKTIRASYKTGFLTYSKDTECIIWKDTYRIDGSKCEFRDLDPKLQDRLISIFTNDTEVVANLHSTERIIKELSNIRILFDTTSAQIKINF